MITLLCTFIQLFAACVELLLIRDCTRHFRRGWLSRIKIFWMNRENDLWVSLAKGVWMMAEVSLAGLSAMRVAVVLLLTICCCCYQGRCLEMYRFCLGFGALYVLWSISEISMVCGASLLMEGEISRMELVYGRHSCGNQFMRYFEINSKSFFFRYVY